MALAALMGGEMSAQDARFSQYYNSPMRLNPALTGVFEGNWRVGANYRTQYGAILGKAYNTYAFGAETKLPLQSHDYIGIGLNVTSDKAGETGYGQTDAYIGFNYMKRLSKAKRGYGRNKSESFLCAGGQVGMGQRGVNWSSLTYSTQYQMDNTYNTMLSSGESMNVRANKLYPDMNLGVLWYGTFGHRRNAYAGGAVYHINQPDISLFNDAPRDSAGNALTATQKLYRRWVAQAGGEVLIGPKSSPISLVPGLVLMSQGPSLELNFGTSIRYQGFKFDDFAFRVGAWGRLSNRLNLTVAPEASKLSVDALVFLLGIDYKGMQFGFSYDATLSTLQQQVNGRGSMEFSVIYTYDGDEKRQQGCPTF